jgi:hypothetical protein
MNIWRDTGESQPQKWKIAEAEAVSNISLITDSDKE